MGFVAQLDNGDFKYHEGTYYAFSAASVASRRPATSRLELVGKRSEPSWPGEGTAFPFSILRLDRAQLEKPGAVMEAFVVE